MRITVGIAFVAVAVSMPPSAAMPDRPVLEITADTTLDPAKTYGRLVIKASNITIDGKGALIAGSAAEPKSFRGIGVKASGVSNVTLKNLTVRGFETGLWVENGRGWTLDNCDFSNNFDDPSFGWGQLGRRGGIVFVGVSGSTIRHCRGNRNWAGCVLERSNDNRLEGSDFSHCSEACLEMWQATGNSVVRNKLDYGNRAKPDEVHARDSCCVLIESGSDGNTFSDNSCTHGGDGIFLRALNGWVSTGNRFVRNDCSFGHNHGVECWCPDNYFEGNKANQCSYGFWMGGSDRSVMVDNEASFNGEPTGNHYSPHLPGESHAGIVFMHGSGTHVVLRGNRCVGNNGAGIALIGDKPSKGEKWKAHHWVVDSNILTGNRWGVYAQYADWIVLDGNALENNPAGGVVKDGGVTNVTERPAAPGTKKPPRVLVDGPHVVRVGRRISFDASKTSDPAGRPLSFRWQCGDGTISDASRVDHVFTAAGFYRVGVTATAGGLSDLGSCDVFVVADGPELGTEVAADRWDWVDPQSKVRFADDDVVKLVGRSSLRADVDPYGGGRIWLKYLLASAEVIDPRKKSWLEFWVRAENQNIPCWQDENPIVTLSGPDGTTRRLKPRIELLNTADHPEARAGWLLVRVPLAGDQDWSAEGPLPRTIDRVSLGFDSWGGKPFRIWLDGMRLE